MFFAHIENNQLIAASQVGALDSQPRFYCPTCHQQVNFCQPRRGRPYFAHQAKRSTGGGESDRHRASKEQMAEILRAGGYEVLTELPIDTIKRRADLCVDKRWVLEIQYAQMSAEEAGKRTSDYHLAGFNLLWLLGHQSPHFKLRPAYLKRLWPFLKPFAQLGLCLPYWHEEAADVRLYALDYYGRLGTVYRLSLPDYLALCQLTGWEEGFNFSQLIPKQAIHSLPPSHYQRRLLEILRRPSQSERRLLNCLYQVGLSLMDLPQILVLVTDKSLLTEEPFWLVLAYTYLVNQGFLTREDLAQALSWRPHPVFELALREDFLNHLFQSLPQFLKAGETMLE
ncbi:competence protein CoiA family protein [Aerococcus sp. UMB7834]|uniref:competence protein CoiA n=1 Tax=Aerococcus sp. UMB7834 TaxID=3046342 RepID=UPI00254E7A88|nr:competence protein CoiA family protein [Aerococcus sp. UMB7834]MDK6805159.1 competence protein CoiA family protein [Aerococcus sp. UMB7834]